jgi:hypothetical protein
MKTYKQFKINMLEEACPAATMDIHVNLKNRQHAIDEYLYGPANPDEPEEFWDKIANVWKIETETAKTMKCENCAAFDISDKMRSCIEAGIKGKEQGVDPMATIEKSDLGYCNFLHFKCAGARTCTAWVHGGAIDDKDLT